MVLTEEDRSGENPYKLSQNDFRILPDTQNG